MNSIVSVVVDAYGRRYVKHAVAAFFMNRYDHAHPDPLTWSGPVAEHDSYTPNDSSCTCLEKEQLA